MIRSVAPVSANVSHSGSREAASSASSASSVSARDPLEASTSTFTLERLAALGATDVATITGVEGAPLLRRRLLEAGFTVGCRVTFVMATPFGDPLVFFLRGASIALRKSEARCVRVRI